MWWGTEWTHGNFLCVNEDSSLSKGFIGPWVDFQEECWGLLKALWGRDVWLSLVLGLRTWKLGFILSWNGAIIISFVSQFFFSEKEVDVLELKLYLYPRQRIKPNIVQSFCVWLQCHNFFLVVARSHIFLLLFGLVDISGFGSVRHAI